MTPDTNQMSNSTVHSSAGISINSPPGASLLKDVSIMYSASNETRPIGPQITKPCNVLHFRLFDSRTGAGGSDQRERLFIQLDLAPFNARAVGLPIYTTVQQLD